MNSQFLAPKVQLKQENDAIYLASEHELGDIPPSILVYLKRWVEEKPEGIFLAQRNKQDPSIWDKLTYKQLLEKATKVALFLDTLPVSKDEPVMILSPNSIESAIMIFACFLKDVPVVPVSSSYSLLSTKFSTLEYAKNLVNAKVVFAQTYGQFELALKKLQNDHLHIITSDEAKPKLDITTLDEIFRQTTLNNKYDLASLHKNENSVAKILFTSGSTNLPKAVPNTHRMLTSNQEAIAKIWPFIEKPNHIFLDWLPWHHTFGGNHNLNMVLRNGGTLYIDGGKPIAGAIQTTVDNLQELSPTVYFNVPAGYDLLLGFLEKDAVLATKFFKDLHILFFAAAALPESIWTRLQALIDQYASHGVPITSSWGLTETAPLSTSVYFHNTIPNNIGLPIPGTKIKLAQVGELKELRVKGPNVMQGYFQDADKTKEAFDEEGYFCSGDAVDFVDINQPEKGLLFKGRVSENFKLFTGTWVNVSSLRMALVDVLSPLVSDIVICGHNQRYISILIFPNIAECKSLLGDEDIFRSAKLQQIITEKLQAYNAKNTGLSRQIKKALLLSTPPSFDEHEITDKGYLNQRGVLKNRASTVAKLYSDEDCSEVIDIQE